MTPWQRPPAQTQPLWPRRLTGGVLAGVLAALLSVPVTSQTPDYTVVPPSTPAVDATTLLGLAEQGDARAAFLLGTRYASGQAGVRDDSEAARWFRQAADGGLAEAQYNLGVLYATGRGVPRNMAQAARWYRLAAEQGSAEAQFNLGTLYGLGQGVPRDEALAARWLEAAAHQEVTEAQYNLGVLYEHGRGVRANAAKAMDWYRKAAEAGYGPAGERLAALEQKIASVAGHGRGSAPAKRAEHTRLPPPPPTLPRPPQRPTASPRLDTAAQPDRERRPPTVGADVDDATVIRSSDWLAAIDPRKYTLQILSHRDEQRARDFIRKHGIESQAAYFRKMKDGTVWFSVVYGLYPSSRAAKAAVTSLPKALKKGQPWVRNIGKIQASMLR